MFLDALKEFITILVANKHTSLKKLYIYSIMFTAHIDRKFTRLRIVKKYYLYYISKITNLLQKYKNKL